MNTSFSQQKSNLVYIYLYFSETHIRSSYPSEGAGGRSRANDRNASIVGRKCADDVAVSVRYVVTVVRI